MIQVVASVRPGCTEIRVTGHEGVSSGEAGCVCAAVSAVTQTAILGLRVLANSYPDYMSVEHHEE